MYQRTALGERSWGCTMGEWAKEGSAVRGEGKETNEGVEKGREECRDENDDRSTGVASIMKANAGVIILMIRRESARV